MKNISTNNQRPLISIVTVVYNGEDYIEKTIQSVISQSFTNYQYIIIDGGSKDGTVSIIKKYEKYLKYWISEPDTGIYDAMNKGIKKATGMYVGLINASDWFEKDAFKNVARIFSKQPDTDIIYSDLYTHNEKTNERILLKTIASYAVLFWLEMRVFHPTLFVKRSIYDKLSYDSNYRIISDLKIILQMMRAGYSFVFSSIPLATYTLGGTSSSGIKILKEELRLKKEFGYSNVIIFASSFTKFCVMAIRLLENKVKTFFT